jgi:hypothetical protein
MVTVPVTHSTNVRATQHLVSQPIAAFVHAHTKELVARSQLQLTILRLKFTDTKNVPATVNATARLGNASVTTDSPARLASVQPAQMIAVAMVNAKRSKSLTADMLAHGMLNVRTYANVTLDLKDTTALSACALRVMILLLLVLGLK